MIRKPDRTAIRHLARWDFREHPILLSSLAKWTVLGTITGVAAGSASALFLWSLDLATATRTANHWLIWFLPLAGLLLGFIYWRFGREVAGGNNLILDQLHHGSGRVPLRMVPFVLGGTLLTHLFGGSAGREGTAVQMGGSLADGIARLLRLSAADRRLLLTGGVAGGFGSVFGTPVAGAVFGMEVTQVGGLRYEALTVAFVAAIVGDLTTRAWGAGHTHYPHLPFYPLDPDLLVTVAVIGIAAGLVSRLFAELEHGLKASFAAFIPWQPLRPVVGGLMLLVAVFGLNAYDYIGLGTPMILQAFTPGAVSPLAFLWKLLLTALTLGAGFQGGEVTPLFFMGATLGSALSAPLGVPVDLAAAAGFIAVFAGAANTPLACMIMGAELFGGGALGYFGLACVAAYTASGHSGIYTAQRVLHPKSKSLPVPASASLEVLLRERRPILRGPKAEVGD